MKVILAAKSVYPFHPFGGVQKYVYYFAKHLVRLGIEVEIVAPLDDGLPRSEFFEGIKYTLIAPRIASYLELPVGWLGVHWFSWQLSKYLEQQQFDVLHSFDLTGLYYLNVSKHKPVIAHIFTDNYLCNPIAVGKYLSLFGYKPQEIKNAKIALSPFASLKMIAQYPAQYFLKTKPMHKYLTGCQKVFIEAECYKDEVVQLFQLNSADVTVVPVGIDVAYVRQNIHTSKVTKEAQGFLKDDYVLLTVNRLAADKGIDKIISALRIIRQTIPLVKLMIVGKGYQEAELLAQIDQYDLRSSVHFIKDVKEEDLYGYYKIADLYVCAFSYPGSSVSSLEAIASGLPIVTTAQPWLINDGNGILISNNDPETIAQAVVSMHEQSAKPNKAELDIFLNGYDWPFIAQSAINNYQMVTSKT